MGQQPNILPLNVRAVEGHIEDDHLDLALDVIKKWADISQSPYRNDVIILKSRYAEINRETRLGSLPFADVSMLKTQLKRDTLCLIKAIV